MVAGHFQGCGNDNDQIRHNVNINVKIYVYIYALLCADQLRVYCRDNRREIAVIAEIREPEGTTDKKTQKYPYIHRYACPLPLKNPGLPSSVRVLFLA